MQLDSTGMQLARYAGPPCPPRMKQQRPIVMTHPWTSQTSRIGRCDLLGAMAQSLTQGWRGGVTGNVTEMLAERSLKCSNNQWGNEDSKNKSDDAFKSAQTDCL